jgi:O-antigen/teichoic acid export membrane protein
MLLLAAAVCVRAPASLCFALYLGLNRAARWGVSDIVRQWGMLLFMLPGFLVAGLRGAALGVLLAELVVFAVGFAGARKYLSWSAMRLDFTGMAPYLKFGFVFWIGDLVLSAFERSGEAMLRALSGDYAQVGYFGVSYSAYVAAAVGVPQVALAFASLLAMLRAEGQMEALREWIERLLTWLSVGAVLVAAAAIMLAGDLVPVVLGQAYRPAAANITVLAISIVMLCLSSVASLSALVFDRPGVTLGAALARLVVFWGLGLLLIPRWGSLGASVAVLGALAGQATYFTMRMRPVVGYSLRRWAAVLGLGLALVPLALLKASFLVNLLLFLVFTAAYVAGLFWLRLVTRSELIALLRAVGLARRPRVAGEEAAS